MRAISTLPLTPVRNGFLTFNAQGFPAPEIIDDYAKYLMDCRARNINPVDLVSIYNARKKRFDESSYTALMPDDCIGRNSQVYESQFLRHLSRPGQIHCLSFSIGGEDMDSGLCHVRQHVAPSLTEQGYQISKGELGFTKGNGQYDDRLILNYRSNNEGLVLELSGGRLLPKDKASELRNWFETLR